MNILQRLLGRSDVVHFKGNGQYALDIVGEGSYQANLEKICGKRKAQGEHKLVEATLFLENSNPHDKHAVRVAIAGMTVGYLSRENAPLYRQRLVKDGHPRGQGVCQAKIKGGWKRKKDIGSYGVWLDMPRL